MKNRGFTLIEIVVVLSLLLIVSTLAIFGYNSMVDKARRKICEGNLKALTDAVEYYSVEFDALPATLGNLRRDHFDRAYVKMIDENPISNRFYGVLAKLDISGETHAAFLTYDNLKPMATEDNFRDPDDANGGVSYGINSSLTGKKWSEIGDNEVIVADSDSATFTGIRDLVSRHRRGIVTSEHLAMALTRGKDLLVFSESAGNDSGQSAEIYSITGYFDTLVNDNIGTSVADKAEDVRNNLYVALSDLSSGKASARDNIADVQSDLQDMINNGLIDSATGTDIIQRLQTISNQL